MAGGGAGARSTRIRSVRMLSTGPLSGLSRPAHLNKDSGLSRPSALVPTARSSILQPHQQQRRLLSIESTEDSASTSEASGVEAEAGDSIESASTESAVEEEGREEATAAVAPAAPAPTLVQVDGIPFTMTQEELEQWFAEAGCTPSKVTMPMWSGDSIRAGQNKGRAYLEMENEEDTETAISLSGRSVGERWIGVARLSMTIEECCTVSLKGMKGFPESDLMQLFEEGVGSSPVHIKIVDNPNRGQGLAFVKFATPEEAKKAITLDGSNVMNQWIDVSLHLTKQSARERRVGSSSEPPFGPGVPDALVILLKGLPFSLTEDEISAFLEQNGISAEDIVEMKVPKYNATQFNTGTAYLHVRNEEASAKAFALKGTYIGDRWVDVSRWNERSNSTSRVSHKTHIENSRSTVPAALRKKFPDLPCVIMSGLPFHKTKAEMTEYLEENGVPQAALEEMQMPLFLQTQNNTGSCWVVINQEEAYNRIMELNGAVVDDRWITIADA